MQVIHNEKTEMRKNYSTRFLVAWLHYKYLTVRVVIYLCGSKRVSQEIFAFVNRNLAKLRLKSLFLEASSQRQLLLPCFPTEQFSTPLVLFLGRNRDKAYLNLDSINRIMYKVSQVLDRNQTKQVHLVNFALAEYKGMWPFRLLLFKNWMYKTVQKTKQKRKV